jgi:hypothetical protein
MESAVKKFSSSSNDQDDAHKHPIDVLIMLGLSPLLWLVWLV